MGSDKLKYGIMCNNNHIARWQLEVVKKLQQSGLCECILIINNPSKNIKKQNLLHKIFSKNLLYNYLINRLFAVEAEKKTSITGLADILTVNIIKKGKYTEYFRDEDITKIKSYQLDFILRFGFGIIRGNILQVAKWGIWSYHHGDEQRYRGGPFGFWEIFNHEKTTSVVLQKLTEKLDAGYILLKREYKTIFHSWKESRQKLLMCNIDMPLQLINIIQHNPDYLSDVKTSPADSKIYRFPTNYIMLLFLFKIFLNRIRLYFNNYCLTEKWQLILLDKKDDITDAVNNYSANKKIIKSNKKSGFYADGFLIDDENYVFENYSYKNAKGYISIINKHGQIHKLIEKDYHLAYPYVFKYTGKTYILPEQSHSGKLELFEYIKETHQVAPVCILLDLPAVDASLYYDGKLFWIFCGIKNDCPNEKLFLFYSNSLTGTYQAHAANPVKVSPVGARCAGNLYNYQQKLIRPAQSCIPQYGSYILLNEITTLDTHQYKEQTIQIIKPESLNKRYKGIHTISLSDNKLLVDVKKNIFNPLSILNKKV